MKLKTLNKLRIEAEVGIQVLLDVLETDSIESGDDEFCGHDREEFIIKFDHFEHRLNEKGENIEFRVRLGIYLKDTDDIWINSLKPIGYYCTIYDDNEELIDELLSIDERD